MSYFISTDRVSQEGPFSLDQLKKKLFTKEISANTLVWRRGLDEWLPLVSVAELVQLLDSIPPPLPGGKGDSSAFLDYVMRAAQTSNYSKEFSAKLLVVEDCRQGKISEIEKNTLVREITDYFSTVQDENREGRIQLTPHEKIKAVPDVVELDEGVKSAEKPIKRSTGKTWYGKPTGKQYRVIQVANILLFVVLGFLHLVASTVHDLFYNPFDFLIFYWIALGLIRLQFRRSASFREASSVFKVGATILCWFVSATAIVIWRLFVNACMLF